MLKSARCFSQFSSWDFIPVRVHTILKRIIHGAYNTEYIYAFPFIGQ